MKHEPRVPWLCIAMIIGLPTMVWGEDLGETKAILESIVRDYCRDVSEPWAAAHGALAEGKSFASSDGSRALPSLVKEHVIVKDGRALFQAFKKDGVPVEPHPGLFAKVALERGDDLAELSKKGLTTARLARDALTLLDLRESLFNQEWLLEVLFHTGTDEALKKKAAKLALDLLEKEQAYMKPYSDAEHKYLDRFEKKLRRVKGRPMADAIHRYFCGGTHLFHAVLLAAHKGLYSADQMKRFETQMHILLFRGRAEASYWDRKSEELDRVKLSEERKKSLRGLFLSQKLKIVGHALETWHKARLWKVYKARKGDAVRLSGIEKALAATVSGLQESGLYQKIPEMAGKASMRQLRRDLIGDSAHALYALNLAAKS